MDNPSFTGLIVVTDCFNHEVAPGKIVITRRTCNPSYDSLLFIFSQSPVLDLLIKFIFNPGVGIGNSLHIGFHKYNFHTVERSRGCNYATFFATANNSDA